LKRLIFPFRHTRLFYWEFIEPQTRQQRLTTVTDAAANLIAQLCELNELRSGSGKRSYLFGDRGAQTIEKERGFRIMEHPVGGLLFSAPIARR